MTQTGTTVGTVAYMSPEQARGQEVDHRTDIWSLGTVFCEMVTGQQPFRGENLLAISKGILESPAPTLTGASSVLNGVVGRALTKNNSDRYQRVADLLDELRSATAHGPQTTRQPDLPSIAVLPFANLSADPEQEYFCDGLAEELIDALARLEGLRVVARTSAFHFKGQSPDLREVGQKLNVKTVLEGSVRKAGNRLRINAQLINTEDGYHLWSDRYDRELDDVFAVQDEIAGSVVGRLKVKLLGAAEASLVRQQTDDVEAFDLCVKGQHHLWKLTVEGIDAALLLFERSLAVDPSYAQAHAGVALIYSHRGTLGLAPPGELLPKAKEAARRAIALDDEVRNAHYVLAQAHQSFDWDWPGAEHEFRRELAVNPGNAEARGLFGLFLLGLGDLAGALRETQRAVDVDPLSPLAHHMRAWVLLEIDRVEDAVRESRQGVQVSGGFAHAYWSLGAGLSVAQRHQEAMDTLREARRLAPGDPMTLGMLGWACARANLHDEATDIAKQLEERQGGLAAPFIAMVFLGLDDHDQAFRWLSRGCDERAGFMCFVPSLVVWKPLRSDPRFQALLRRMNFPETTALS